MKILLALHQYFPRFYTGTETLTLEVARELQAKGHSVSILCVEPDTPDISYPVEPELHLDSYDGMPVWRLFTGHANYPVERLDRESKDDKLVPFYEEVMQKENPDIVHAFHLMRLTLSFVETVKKHEIPFYLTTTDFWLLCPTYQQLKYDGSLCTKPQGRTCFKCLLSMHMQNSSLEPSQLVGVFNQTGRSCKRILDERIKRNQRILKMTDGVFWSNTFLREMFLSNEFTPLKHKIVTFPVPSKASDLFSLPLAKAGPELRVAFVGTLMPSKGPQVIIQAVKNLEPQIPVKLSIWGAPLEGKLEFENELKKLAEGERRIFFKGTFPQEKFSEVLEDIDILVIPSLWYENTPLTALSALAARRLILVSDLGGLSPLVENGRNGFVFPPGDDLFLTKLLTRLVKDKTKLPSLAKNINPPRRVTEYVQELISGYKDFSSGVDA